MIAFTKDNYYCIIFKDKIDDIRKEDFKKKQVPIKLYKEILWIC
jgi:hypothetical protein